MELYTFWAATLLIRPQLFECLSECVNGAAPYWSDPRLHYAEGYGLDRFAAGDWLLHRGERRAGTAEHRMMSRYSAFATGHVE